MKTKNAIVFALLLVGCGQAVEDSRTVTDNLDPDSIRDTATRSSTHLDREINDFSCVVGDSRCWLDGVVYTCGFDGESYGYFDTGATCDNTHLFALDARERRDVDIFVATQHDWNPSTAEDANQSDAPRNDSGSYQGTPPSSNGESANSGGGGGLQGL